MSARSAAAAVATALVAVLAACSPGGSSGGPPADGGTPPGGTPPGGTPPGGTPPGGTPPGGGTGGGTGGTVTQPPGTTQPSSSGGSRSLQIGANAGPGGALFFNDRPAAGEPQVSGLVVVRMTDGSSIPTDMVVTLNGVALVHATLGGAVSPSYFTLDPSGTQPTITTDGFLHLSASSVAAGASRTLDLACPNAIAITATPAEGASLTGVADVQLAWAAGALPVQARDYSTFGLVGPSASIHGWDPATATLTFVANPIPLAADAAGAAVPVGATTAPAYAVELRYPGVFFLDGETGGACGRTQRLLYSK